MKRKSSLIIKNLYAGIEKKQILYGIDIKVKSGEVHAVMGPNGSGKSTLANVLMGNPMYEVKYGKKTSFIKIDSKNISEMTPDKRAKLGLFVSFQSPPAVSGVSVIRLLREALADSDLKKKRKKSTIQNPVLSRKLISKNLTYTQFLEKIKKFSQQLNIREDLLSRGIHDDFSGGERKKIEMLEALMLEPKFAIFDEIDTGLDVDAMRLVARGLKILQKQETGIVLITHYLRILKHINPDFVHVMSGGKIVDSGDHKLASIIEKNGYKKYKNI
ncbi:Fe-S cluster assembly ATPase SufC [Patescibacteria group bacterium]